MQRGDYDVDWPNRLANPTSQSIWAALKRWAKIAAALIAFRGGTIG